MSDRLSQSRDALRQAVDYADAYLDEIGARNVAASDDALAGLQAFDRPLPEAPSSPEDTLAMLHTYGAPATTATTGGRFFGLVVGGTLPATLGARALASAWDQVVTHDVTSPVGVKLEQVASRWLLEILGLPAHCSVGFVTGTTMANFTALAGARHAQLTKQGWDVQKRGLWNAPPLRIVAGEQTHITALKALSMLGIGTDRIEWVKCDAQGRMRLDHLPETDDTTIVLTQSGNVNSGASDPIAQIAARANGAWVHVDGAFGLWAAASPATQGQLAGYSAADSWATDGHKWLNTPYDCGMVFCKHPASIHAAMATQAPYLKVGDTAAPKDMAPEFSRAARGVEIWAALHSLGKAGVAALVDRTCAHARMLAEGLGELGFEILNDVVLNQVVATLPGEEAICTHIAAEVRKGGVAWFGPTHWQDRDAIRFSVASWMTDEDDIRATLAAVQDAMRTVR